MSDEEIMTRLEAILPLADLDVTPARSIRLKDDLGMDSLAQVDCLIAIEREFSLSVLDETATSWTDIGDIIDYIRINVSG